LRADVEDDDNGARANDDGGKEEEEDEDGEGRQESWTGNDDSAIDFMSALFVWRNCEKWVTNEL